MISFLHSPGALLRGNFSSPSPKLRHPLLKTEADGSIMVRNAIRLDQKMCITHDSGEAYTRGIPTFETRYAKTYVMITSRYRKDVNT